MDVFDMIDPAMCELNALRVAGETEEAKHDCEGCRDRIGIPCLIAKSCKKIKGGLSDGKGNDKG